MNTPVSYSMAKLLDSKEVRFENIADVVMWLYEKHGIWINVCPTIIEYNYRKDSIGFIYHITKLETYLNYGKMYGSEDVGIFQNSYYFNSPTEAYESAIEYALNNLINGV
jgi:hypothetical protein